MTKSYQIVPPPGSSPSLDPKRIAELLSVTEETVKGRVKNILSKLNANDRTHAATIGLRRGIIEL